ncbi:MAG: hypothetical protein ABI609_06330 [Acidobacteriota bacterium]
MGKSTMLAGGLLLLATLASALPGQAQIQGLYYQEVEKDGRVYVFNTPERLKAWQASNDMGTAVSLIGRGPNGETIVGENETAVDLYLFKHNLPAYDRPTPKPVVAPAFPKTTISGRAYADFSSKENKDKGTGIKSSDSGVGIDFKRFYFTVNHDFDAVWSAQFQSDIGDQGAKRYDVFVKKAFIQAKLSPAAIFRLGSADTPWVPFAEGQYGLRYFEQVITDHLSFGTSADWGIHFLGKVMNDKVGYQISLVNGKGYSNPTRTKSMDIEGRLNFEPIKGLMFAVGGYSGKLGNDTDAVPAKHTATRTNALVQYSNDMFKIGGEYFSAENWKTVTAVAADKTDGYSIWGQFYVDKQFSVFARYDTAKPSKTLKPALEDKYYNLGLQYRFNKSLAGSLGYKHAEVKGGTLGTGNGTIGSTVAGRQGEYNEIGVWAIYEF